MISNLNIGIADICQRQLTLGRPFESWMCDLIDGGKTATYYVNVCEVPRDVEQATHVVLELLHELSGTNATAREAVKIACRYFLALQDGGT